jgi:H+-translocating diphosphatase
MMIESNVVTLIYSFGGLGLLFGAYNIYKVYSIEAKPINSSQRKSPKDEEDAEMLETKNIVLTKENCDKLIYISDLISSGANVFLMWEYLCLLAFIIVFGTVIFLTAEHYTGTFYTTFAFVLGALTSIFCGFVGMKIATASNYRTAYRAQYLFFI